VTELGTKIDPEKDVVKFDGKRLISKKLEYLILYKPQGYITAMRDDKGFRTLADLGIPTHLSPAGRLDYNSEGLIFLSNDGELVNKIIHPKYHLPKYYEVKIQGIPTKEDILKIEGGIYIEDKKTMPIKAKIMKQTDKNSWLSLKLYEGRNRIIRKIFDKLGYNVLKLKRTQIANLKIGALRAGDCRQLTTREIEQLRNSIVKTK
jgi:pseudouridine synthase